MHAFLLGFRPVGLLQHSHILQQWYCASKTSRQIVHQSLDELRLEGGKLLSDGIWQAFECYSMKSRTANRLERANDRAADWSYYSYIIFSDADFEVLSSNKIAVPPRGCQEYNQWRGHAIAVRGHLHPPVIRALFISLHSSRHECVQADNKSTVKLWQTQTQNNK